ncbi:MAG: ribose-phosphate pyrophosphokinase [Candidatus Hydrothermales bacterium]
MNKLKILCGTASWELRERICKKLGIEPTDIEVSRFSDGEIRVQIKENIRGCDVFIVQSTHPPSDNLMELLLLIDAAVRASAKRVTAVVPYFGYARQDRKDAPRVPISAKLVANLIQTAGADRVLTCDLHSDQIQGFFDIPVDNLYAFPVFRDFFGVLPNDRFVVVSPDVGGTNRARAFAKRLGNLPLALLDKRRPAPNLAEIINVIGDVKDKNLLIVDDLIDTGKTVSNGAVVLKEKGARSIWVCATHALLSENCKELLESSPIEKVIVTNTIPIPHHKRFKKLEILDISGLLAEAIKRIHEEVSISELFI